MLVYKYICYMLYVYVIYGGVLHMSSIMSVLIETDTSHYITDSGEDGDGSGVCSTGREDEFQRHQESSQR